jgi:deazaflavin-dependent oxidoreductase (nitroreductase family)
MPQTRYIRYVPSASAIKRIGEWHVRLYRATGGLIGRRVDGLDILLLTTVGNKTGLTRTVPLPYFRDGGRLVLVASFGGNAKHPAWFHNLKARPEVAVQVGKERFNVRAVVTEGGERARLWAQLTHDYPRYLNYQAKTERQIPLVALERS